MIYQDLYTDIHHGWISYKDEIIPEHFGNSLRKAWLRLCLSHSIMVSRWNYDLDMFWNCIQVFCGFFILFVDVGNGKFLILPGKNSDPVNHITGYYKVIYIITEPVNELKPGIFKKSFAPYMDIRNKYSLSDPIFPIYGGILGIWNIRPYYPIYKHQVTIGR